jgi:hypothetical protein
MEDDEDDEDKSDAALLQEIRNKIEATLRQPCRNLTVKNIVVAFEASSVYGKREQFLPALIVTDTGPQSCCLESFPLYSCDVLHLASLG